MIIRKKFNVESAHIVRNCTSERCSHSIHGHSAIIEVFLESNYLDNAQMVYDFGLMKGTIKQFIDGMDHCYLLCSKDREEFKDFIKEECDRYIELPFNPSAEMLSLFVFWGVSRILEATTTNNGECDVRVKAVRYHETATGYAECDSADYQRWCAAGYDDINKYKFSDQVIKEMDDYVLGMIRGVVKIDNPIIKQQIKLK